MAARGMTAKRLRRSASSGKTTRHRLNRGGDRAAKSARHIIAIGRLRDDPRTKTYMAKRIA
jgi:transposase